MKIEEASVAEAIIAGQTARAHVYRADVDGLRAVAVLAVILFHAFPDYFRGGFIGVDIFFVISGYLISGIILNELRSGEFSYARFYARRIRRIFPALVMVLVATLAMGWYLLTAKEWRSLTSHAVAAVGFCSNFISLGVDSYFDAAAKKTPLLHLWSLAVEEQFYLVWPLVLGIGWKLARGRKREFVGWAIAGIGLISFGFGIWVGREGGPMGYYHPIGRAWELLAGAALAEFGVGTVGDKGRVGREMLSLAGAVLIGLGLWRLDEGLVWPGWGTLVPVVGAVLLIGAGPGAWLQRRVLAWKPLVVVGLVSYPLYLWHWPLLVYLRLVELSLIPFTHFRYRALGMAGTLLLVPALAWLTYRYCERPIRFSMRLSSRWRVGLPVAAMAVVGAMALLGGSVRVRLDQPVVAELERAQKEMTPTQNGADEPGGLRSNGFKTAEVRSQNYEAAFMVGDSHMAQYLPRVEVAIRSNPGLLSAVFATSGGCAPLPGMNLPSPGFHCDEFYDYWRAMARQKRFRTIAISAYWYHYSTLPGAGPENYHGRPATAADYDAAWTGLADDLRQFLKDGKRVVMFGASPVDRGHSPEVGISRVFDPGMWRLQGMPRAKAEEQRLDSDRTMLETAKAVGAEVISPEDWLCNRLECPALDTDGTPIYSDEHHIRGSKAAKLAVYVDDVLKR